MDWRGLNWNSNSTHFECHPKYHILGQLPAMTVQTGRSHILRLDVPTCEMRAESAERLAQPRWLSTQRWLTWISVAHRRCPVKEASSFVARSSLWSSLVGTVHCPQVAFCHRFSRQETRKGGILYTYSVVAFCGNVTNVRSRDIIHDQVGLH